MSDVTAVPLRPIKRSALTALWIGIGLLVVIGVAAAWAGTERQVRMATPPAAFLAKNATRDGVHTTPSGLQYKILKPGTGPRPTANDVVVVDYVGKLASGETFDASALHGGPATLPVGGVIPGWVEGLQLMNEGSEYRFWIPPELGYGPAGAGDGVIPPNALLTFDVTLRGIKPGGIEAMMRGMGGLGGMGGAAPEGVPPGGEGR
ncbi:FKBP-type peptidyl-prolyl cis-trans isomerase [Sphingomonas jatrophae]|uniref:Peptidyl-prolyl cis-trans isomerase n=1 Tax=Sphingomonas jatrophae TaxID=1166337 RepID=A0A1I6LLQ4_9SPHN|nr:FKBP-type peptidyl-prolyl cis-trans isomerase [Sphingomonas jatrophae]SFS04396.1 Domain amino terminal to FKBP-type peptidyl-prolyl isomerase [Sphingomonas jatrophae]